MGYQTKMLAIDLGALRGVLGSKDAALLARLTKKAKKKIASHNAFFEDEIGEGAPKLEDALAALIEGKPLDEEHGFAYGYAFELLCDQMGKEIGDPESVPAFFSDLKIPTKLGEGDHRLPVAIPKPKDFPGIGYLTREEMQQEIEAFAPVADQYDESDPEAFFIATLKKAFAMKRDVVTFTY